MLGGGMPLCLWCSWKRRRPSAVALGRPADEGREGLHVPNVVVARLLGKAAHRHVLDHARPQRADGLVGRRGDHWGLLSRAEGCWTFNARDRMPRSSRLTAYASPPLPNMLRPRRCPPARAGSFSGGKRTIALSDPG